MESTEATQLSKEDCAAIVTNLEAAIAILDRNTGRRSLPEVKVRSMLSVLRTEVAKIGASRSPFVAENLGNGSV